MKNYIPGLFWVLKSKFQMTDAVFILLSFSYFARHKHILKWGLLNCVTTTTTDKPPLSWVVGMLWWW